MSRAVPLLPYWAFVAGYKVTVTFLPLPLQSPEKELRFLGRLSRTFRFSAKRSTPSYVRKCLTAL